MKAYQAIEKYKRNIVKNNVFMMDSLEEETKYINHNKYRYMEALAALDVLFSKKHDLNLLDIGTSPFTFILKKRYKNIKIYTLDYTDKFKSFCQSKKIIFKKVDLSKNTIPFSEGMFRIVTFLEVIEHVDIKHDKLLLNVGKIMATNGFCILQTPNKYSPKSIISNFLGLKFWKILSESPTIGKEFRHVKEYSLKELTHLIGKQKIFEVVKKKHSMYFDEVESAIVYRKNIKFSVALIRANYFLVKKIAFLRRGMQLILRKK